jgi:Phosphotransferase enzyme family
VASHLQSQNETWRILLPRRDYSEILLSTRATSFFLPEVTIPRGRRTTEHVNAEMKRRWNLEVISLFSPQFAPDAFDLSRFRYYAVESLDSNARPPDGARWTPVSALTDTSFADAHDFEAIRQFLLNCKGGLLDSSTGPFGKPGWFPEVLQWVQEEIRAFDLRLNGRFQQFSSAPAFSLIRFETNEMAIWFKAVGEPNLREFPITLELARVIPSYVPRLMASRPEWNAWLAREAEGSELFGTEDTALWETAARALAGAQMESAPMVEGLLALGAHDARVASLLQLVDPFFRASSEAMARQTKAAPPSLKESELQSLKAEVKQALGALESTHFPDTCGHLDLNPQNIVAAPGKCTFLDWAEACVAHPVLSYEYLREHFRRAFPGNNGGRMRLTESYVASWASSLPLDAIDAALAVAPLLAVFTYAVTCTDWRDLQSLAQPSKAAYLRSLTRRMKQEAQWLSNSRNLCRT